MRKTYKAKLVELDKKGYSVGDIVKVIGNSFDKKIVSMATTDAVYSSIYQAQRLVITDEAGADVAVYPKYELAPIPQIDLSDILRWIDEGCKESVELEMDIVYGSYEDYEENETVHTTTAELVLTNNTVKMVWGEKDKAQPIAGEVEENKSLSALQRAIDKLGDAKMREIADSIPYDPNGMTADEYFARLSGHHPATDWDALRDKFEQWYTYTLNRPDPIAAKMIFNFFKNEINGK